VVGKAANLSRRTRMYRRVTDGFCLPVSVMGHAAMNMDARIHAEHDFRDHAQIMMATEAAGRASTCSSAR
jgi:hypothetical protein